jgi:glycerophosphoryl diester phosphodiesterase
VWTVDDPGRIAELATLGVDGIVTNVPDVAREILKDTAG